MQDPTGSGEYIFDPAELSFSVGETVTFDLTSEGEFHTFTITELDINAAVNAGDTASIEVTFDTAGTYELICIPHQALGMVGTITVE
jgi:plastocyanin